MDFFAKSSNNILDETMNSSPSVSVSAEDEKIGQILRVNQAFRQAFGYNQNDLRGEN
jgi:PAS domain S-box-containing protein